VFAALTKAYLPRSWINPKLAGGPSKIHGEGVIASAAIAAGEKLMEFGGEATCAKDLESNLYREQSVWRVGDDLFLALRWDDPEPSLDENLNHSCDANAWLDGEVALVARRAIAAGEEITLDQGTWNFDDEAYVWDRPHCACGMPLCRKTLTNDDWRLPDVQARYRGHFHPHLQRMIDAK
jgi:SET domain-containing protein